jgi:hypothetical protein
LQQGAFIGLIENVSDSEKRQLDPNYVNAIAEKHLNLVRQFQSQKKRNHLLKRN